MRKEVFRKAGEIVARELLHFSCPAIVAAGGEKELCLWKEMHQPPAGLLVQAIWFGNADEGRDLRIQLLLEAALNLEEQGFE